jgi:hypothetical protein
VHQCIDLLRRDPDITLGRLLEILQERGPLELARQVRVYEPGQVRTARAARGVVEDRYPLLSEAEPVCWALQTKLVEAEDNGIVALFDAPVILFYSVVEIRFGSMHHVIPGYLAYCRQIRVCRDRLWSRANNINGPLCRERCLHS